MAVRGTALSGNFEVTQRTQKDKVTTQREPSEKGAFIFLPKIRGYMENKRGTTDLENLKLGK